MRGSWAGRMRSAAAGRAGAQHQTGAQASPNLGESVALAWRSPAEPVQLCSASRSRHRSPCLRDWLPGSRARQIRAQGLSEFLSRSCPICINSVHLLVAEGFRATLPPASCWACSSSIVRGTSAPSRICCPTQKPRSSLPISGGSSVPRPRFWCSERPPARDAPPTASCHGVNGREQGLAIVVSTGLTAWWESPRRMGSPCDVAMLSHLCLPAGA